jgi:DNA-binding IclR family transcriptional regulator
MASMQLTDRTLDVLEAVVAAERISLPKIASECGLPHATAHRILQVLVGRGYVSRITRGEYRPGSTLSTLAGQAPPADLLAETARPLLKALSKTCRKHVHMGLLESDMVTYLVKLPYGRKRIHSAEGQQLEAYCSGLGKVLLAQLRPDELDAYLSAGALVALTPKTITDQGLLRAEIVRVRQSGWAIDNEEIAVGLRCLAVPVKDAAGKTIAAISASDASSSLNMPDITDLLPAIKATATEISARLFPATVRTAASG